MRFQYQTVMSLDGFIAGPRGDLSWIGGPGAANPIMDDVFPRVGAILCGGNTFRGGDPNAGTEHEGAYEGKFDGPAVVLTRRPPAEPVDGVMFASELDRAMEMAAAEAGDKEYVTVLGAGVARSMIEAGKLDEVLVIVSPVLLGDGVRLFDHPGGRTVRLDVIRADTLTLQAAIQV